MNPLLTKALQEEESDQFVSASNTYEQIISTGGGTPEVYINLAVLYWQCTELGFLAYHRLDLSFVKFAGLRYEQAIAKAADVFPDYPEIDFWNLYFRFITLGDPPFEEQCLRIVSRPNAGLVPYFYLYMANKANRYGQEVERLLAECRTPNTLKNRYITSVINAVHSQAARRLRTAQRLQKR